LDDEDKSQDKNKGQSSRNEDRLPDPEHRSSKTSDDEDEYLDYEALSYVWGTADDPIFVQVQATPRESSPSSGEAEPSTSSGLLVTQNLAIALKHLRHADAERLLWIDAICIDQENISERSEQVSRMGQIFSRAHMVIVWLGPEYENSKLAMETIYSFEDNIFWTSYDIKLRPGSRASHLHNDLTSLRAMKESWIAIRDIFQREWFTRLWVFQEIRLASNAVVQAGNYQMKWNDLVAVFYWIQSTPFLSSLGLFETHDLIRIHYFVQQTPTDVEFGWIIQQTRYLLCADPRDRVFAILDILPEQNRLGIVPDYSRSISEVYTDLVLRHITQTSLLYMLENVSWNPVAYSILELPSWIQDFDDNKGPVPLYSHLAAGRSQADWNYLGHGRLRISGLEEAVLHVEEPISPEADLPRIIATLRTIQLPNTSG